MSTATTFVAQTAASDLSGADPKQTAAIAQRRALEAERLKRIKNPRLRTMGVDKEALDAQIREKQEAAAAQAALDAAYAAQAVAQDAHLAYLEAQKRRAQREHEEALLAYRSTMQGKSTSREFDLNDPRAKLDGAPARVGDDDPRLSTSGMQKFNGEDLEHAARLRQQQRELKAWCEEHSRIKAAAKAKEDAEDEAFTRRAMEMDEIKMKMDLAAKQARQAATSTLAEFNQAQATAKKEREMALAAEETAHNVKEIQDHLLNLSGTATGDPSKGFTEAQRDAIKREQLAQLLEARERKARQEAEENAELLQMEQLRLRGLEQDALLKQMREEMRNSVMEENLALAATQAATKAFLNEQFTNEIDASFFEQFNTSSR